MSRKRDTPAKTRRGVPARDPKGDDPVIDTNSHPRPFRDRRAIIGLVLLAVAVLVTYGNTLRNDFIQDDKAEILRNPLVRDFSRVSEIFTSAAWAFGSAGPYQLGSSYYRPIQYLSYACLFRVFGLDPWGYHLYKLLSHLAVCWLFFWIVWRHWRDYPAALCSSMLFTVHTANTEAVSWVSGITDTTCAFFFLLSLLVYLKDRSSPTTMKLLLLSSLFLLGLLSKETMATFVGVIFLYDWIETGRFPSLKHSFRVFCPLLAVFVVYLILRINAIGGFTNPRQIRFDFLNPFQIVLNQIALLSQYIGLFFFPARLNAYHVFEPLTSPLSYRFAFAAFVLVASLLGFWVLFKQLDQERRKPYLLGLVWFITTLLPVLVFFQRLGENVFTERYIYLPSLGICLSVCLALGIPGGESLHYFRPRWRSAGTWLGLLKMWIQAAKTLVFVLLLATLSWKSIQRNHVWQNDLIFYETTTQASPKAWGLLNNLGAEYNRSGRHGDALRVLEASVAGGASPTALKNLGDTYWLVGRATDSETAYRRAIALDPMDSGAYFSLGDVLSKQGRYSEAIGSYEKSLALYPASSLALFAYAEACFADHRYDDSERALKKVVLLSPGEQARAYRQLAKVYSIKNLPELAAEAERQAAVPAGVQLFR